ncbi:hypothetical protein OZ410_01620 [Robiginitalea sp. M366]|uniref:hypothetical protein n=1 Tax=Robiginitalea aestuariiviva TaxID=3036903 RepID=UPI00240D512B|nr:hypothetical protein [Robiginitalea aestuariiviva]MDG1570998.1 hypothetical protein [Robiginitalea aestuariiviva]
MKKAVFFLLLLLAAPAIYGQCAMCRAVLESGGDNGVAEGINNGIIYLMAIPYVLVGAIIFLVYRKLKS